MLVLSSGLMTFELPLELGQGGAGTFHFGLQFLEFLLHEGSQSCGVAKANVEGVLDIGIGDRVGDVGGQAFVRRAIGDQKNIGIRRPRDLEVL